VRGAKADFFERRGREDYAKGAKKYKEKNTKKEDTNFKNNFYQVSFLIF
jgi:hypothetical protein